MIPRLPSSTDRLTVIGRTGSGKTVASLWQLSRQSFDLQPWVIFNFKNDKLIDSLEEIGAHSISLDFVPRSPGIYILHPLPMDSKPDKRGEPSKVEEYLWKIWDAEGIGVYCDEGYMMGDDNDAFEALLTQGRSRYIPMIVCAQRPAWISRFCFSEANFYQVFDLNDVEDKRRVRQFSPIEIEEYDDLPPYNSFYYDIGRKQLFKFSPVPNEGEIKKAIESKLPKRKRIHI